VEAFSLAELRTAFPQVLSLTGWLGLPAARFTRGFAR